MPVYVLPPTSQKLRADPITESMSTQQIVDRLRDEKRQIENQEREDAARKKSEDAAGKQA